MHAWMGSGKWEMHMHSNLRASFGDWDVAVYDSYLATYFSMMKRTKWICHGTRLVQYLMLMNLCSTFLMKSTLSTTLTMPGVNAQIRTLFKKSQ